MSRKINDEPVVPTMIPEHDIFIKLSVQTAVLDEKYIASLFKLKEIHTEDDSLGLKIVSTFTYLNPLENAEIAQSYGINTTGTIINTHIPKYIQFYGPVNDFATFSFLLQAVLNASAGQDIKGALSNLGLYMPSSEANKQLKDEYLQLDFLRGMKDSGNIRVFFNNHSVIKREEDIISKIEEMAKQEDLISIFSTVSHMVSMASEKSPEMPSPYLLVNSPQEMLEKLLNIERIGGGYVKYPRASETIMSLTMTLDDGQEFATLIEKIANQNSEAEQSY